MSYDYEKLNVEMEDKVLVAEINNPPANAMGSAVINDLSDLLDNCIDDDNVRVIIITGSGNKLFSAGADIKELLSMEPNQESEYQARDLYLKIENFPKVIIAALQGSAFGGGLELVCACHLRYMAESAMVGLPEVKLGIIPGWGGTQRLTRIIGKTRALELMLTGDFITAQEAVDLGLINKAVAADAVLDEAKAMAKRLAGGAPLAQREILKAVTAGLETTLEEGVSKVEFESFNSLLFSEDFKEGAEAFFEKRPADFKGK